MSDVAIGQLLSAIARQKSATSASGGLSSFATLMAAQMAPGASSSGGTESLPGGDFSLLASGLLGGMDLSALSQGDASTKDMLLLFCMMLSSGSSSDSMGYMLTSLASALQHMSNPEKELLRSDVLGSNFSGDVLSQANQTFFQNTSDAIIPYDAWKAVTPAVTSSTGNRSAALYRSVLDQFQVETNPRYKVNKYGTGDTYCNIFVWDVTRAMNAEIPHYIDAATNAPRLYPDVKGATELSANGIYDWLGSAGARYGWHPVTAEQAQALANAGAPVVTTWKNPSGSGHVQMVCPSANGAYDPSRGVTVAQAGSKLYNYAYITQVFNDPSKVLYYAHV